MMMLSCVQKPRTWLVYLQKTLFFAVFSTIFCEPRESLWTEPTMLLACRHAQIDLFTWRKWIRVGISTLQPLKVEGGQSIRDFFLVCKN